jgi:hypothetical protein
MIDLSESELIARAVEAQRRWCARHGLIYDEPGSVELEGKQVVLRNCRGELARFDIVRADRTERLRRAKPNSR